MTDDRVKIWVHPNFRKKLKKECVENDISMIDLTKRLSKGNNREEERSVHTRKRGFILDF